MANASVPAVCLHCGKSFTPGYWGKRTYCSVACRLWAKVTRLGPDECWLWTGNVNDSGHGHIKVDGRMVFVHRVAWRLTNGEIPDGLCVLHRCDNPPCCNPAHLFVGTQADNILDCVTKARHNPRQGALNGEARLTESEVREIRRRYAAGGVSQEALATEFGVRQAHVSRIILGRSWGHINK